MKKYIAITSLVAAMALASCGDANDDVATGPAAADPVTTPGTITDPAATGTMPPATDGLGAMDNTGAPGEDMSNVQATEQEREALGVLNAINEHEIAASNQAMSKNITGEAADYARRMVEEHTSNRDMTLQLNPANDSAMASAQKTKSEAALQRLDAVPAATYQQAFIEAMVEDHTEALDAIDNKLLAAATTPQVQAHLQRTRDAIAMHLEEAQRLHKQTGSN